MITQKVVLIGYLSNTLLIVYKKEKWKYLR